MYMQTERIDAQKTTRESGIELLKIIAIFLIVISHVVRTLCAGNSYISYQDYVLDLSAASTNLQYFLLVLFRHFGVLGNTVFFVSSAWFLLGSSQFKKRKWLFMLIEIWVISVIILIVTYIITGGNISGRVILKSLFPTLFAFNWYLTCYLLFYPIHPLLNTVIRSLDKRHLFRISAALFTLYCVFGFIDGSWFFPSLIILWITFYFVMAYIQLYLVDFSNDLKKNGLLFLIGLIGFVGLPALTNFLGLRISFLRNQMLRWSTNCNPFLIAMAIAMFNIARNIHFRSGAVNYIAGLSMLIYIIHENIILSNYFRPYIINAIYTKYGYDHIVLWVLFLSVGILLFGIVCSVLYDKTLRKLVRKLCDWLYPIIRKGYLLIEKCLLEFH